MIIRRAFTMIELVWVIVILGILAAVAFPKFAASRTDAEVAKARSTVAAVRSGIVNERQTRLFRGDNAFITKLDGLAATTATSGTVFDNNGTASCTILMYGVELGSGSGKWRKTANNQYTISINGYSNAAVFTYNASTGIFNCVSNDLCDVLTH